MKHFIIFIFICLSSMAYAEDVSKAHTCQDPLAGLLHERYVKLSFSLQNILDRYDLEKFNEDDQAWRRTVKQWCASGDCECLIDHYQKRNIKLSQKLAVAKAESRTKIVKFTGEDIECGFNTEFPDNMLVFAGGAGHGGVKSPYRIGERGEQARIVRVTVNSPDRPVALLLQSYSAVIWEFEWTEKTVVKAVYIMGYEEQAIVGLPKTVPLSIVTNHKKRFCGKCTIDQNSLGEINPLSNKLFNRNVKQVVFAEKEKLLFGPPLGAESILFTSNDTKFSSFKKDAPLRGEEALEAAVVKGILRRATKKDMDRWYVLIDKKNNVPPVANPKPNQYGFALHNGYVILKPFEFPKGLYGAHSATFFLEKGVPDPTGDMGHSALYDFNTLRCKGTICSIK